MSEFPSGTITFLFTDIEDSTRLWEEHAQAMRLALARHDALLRQIIESNGGVVFKTIGDAFCAAFPAAPDALAAALEAQRALHIEPWAGGVTLRVRMALHTGMAELRDDDYFGPPLNRVARLLAIGHGGQTLLSEATQALVASCMSPDASLRDMGIHRLKGLQQQPQQVWQLCGLDLPAEFPPLRSLDPLLHNLPVQTTSFIGRDKETTDIKALLAKTRLFTLTGSGGCGKTRLALQVAYEVVESYPQGAWLVELAPLTDSSLVPQTVAQALGVKDEAGKSMTQTLADALKPKHLLLVLDNCEHLLSACASLIETLLHTCPHIKILVSSREGLNIAGELTYMVPSLSLPQLGQPVTAETAGKYEAARLFIERAQFQQPTFALTAQNASTLVAVCRRLDGIPLAIELAAARVRAMPLEQIHTRLDDCFRLLTGGSRTALPRQQTLRALIDWSYGLLSDVERSLLLRVSVFAGGWTLEAAEQVCMGEGMEEWEILDLLTALVDKSLMVYEEQEGQARYRLLETVRQYARERLEASGQAVEYRQRHADYYATLAVETEPRLMGPEQGALQEMLEQEHDNMRAALTWGRENGTGAMNALRLASRLWRFWMQRGYWKEGREQLRVVLDAPQSHADSELRSRVLNGAGILAYRMGDFTQARLLLEGSLAVARRREDKRGIAAALASLGHIPAAQGQFVEAQAMYAEALALWREQGNEAGAAYSLLGLGNVAASLGEMAAAQQHYEDALALFRRTEDAGGELLTVGNLGGIALMQNDGPLARTHTEQALTLCRRLKRAEGEALYLPILGAAYELAGDMARARECYRQGLQVSLQLGDKRTLAATLETLAAHYFRAEEYTQAARYYGCTDTGYAQIAMSRSLREDTSREDAFDTLRDRLGEDTFSGYFSAGQKLSLEELARESVSG